jgi:glycosyltransferase involved in cell wall biosynthesis
MNYAIIIPAKNEEETLRNTLNSVVNQSLLPVICLIVDDGSDDKTPDIIQEFEAKYSFIKYCFYEGVKQYVLGGNVVRVFNYGKEFVDNLNIDYDFIVKMDADLSFDNNFFSELDEKINADEWGIVSGTPYLLDGEEKVFEYSPTWHSHGQFKVYNKKCLEEIGGIDKSLGWDCSDNIKAIYAGWKTAAFRDIYYLMYRQVGGKSNLVKGRINHGIGAYKLGYSILYMFLRSVHDLFKPPVFLGSVYLMYGYLKSIFSSKTKRILSKPQVKLLRNLLWNSLFQRFRNNDFVVLQKINKSN